MSFRFILLGVSGISLSLSAIFICTIIPAAHNRAAERARLNVHTRCNALVNLFYIEDDEERRDRKQHTRRVNGDTLSWNDRLHRTFHCKISILRHLLFVFHLHCLSEDISRHIKFCVLWIKVLTWSFISSRYHTRERRLPSTINISKADLSFSLWYFVKLNMMWRRRMFRSSYIAHID